MRSAGPDNEARPGRRVAAGSGSPPAAPPARPSPPPGSLRNTGRGPRAGRDREVPMRILPPSRRAATWGALTLVALAWTSANAAKPLHIDDATYYHFAEQV